MAIGLRFVVVCVGLALLSMPADAKGPKRTVQFGQQADTDATLRSLEKHLAVEMRDLVNARIDSSDPAVRRYIDLLITEADAQMRRVGVLRGLITISLRHYEGFQESE